jgi:hypothetical protein
MVCFIEDQQRNVFNPYEGIVQCILEDGADRNNDANVLECRVPCLLVAPSINAVASNQQANLMPWQTFLECL